MLKKVDYITLTPPSFFIGVRKIIFRGRNMTGDVSVVLYEESKTSPVLFGIEDARKVYRKYALYKDQWYLNSEGLSADDVAAVLKDREHRTNLKLEAVRVSAAGAKTTREPIASEIQRAVWQRDKGTCVKCGIQSRLHLDHIIPVSRGGSNSVANIQILCSNCNLKKGTLIGG